MYTIDTLIECLQDLKKTVGGSAPINMRGDGYNQSAVYVILERDAGAVFLMPYPLRFTDPQPGPAAA